MISNSTPVQCPYIPEHKMHIDSFITHLNRCKATNKHLFANCLYNSLHVVLKQNYKDHLESKKISIQIVRIEQNSPIISQKKKKMTSGIKNAMKDQTVKIGLTHISVPATMITNTMAIINKFKSTAKISFNSHFMEECLKMKN